RSSDLGEPRAHRRRTRDVGGERSLETRRCRAAALDQRDPAGGELPERTRHLLEALDAYGLEIVAEDGLNGPLPAALDLECGREPRPRRESGAAQPLPGLSGMVGERRRLQGLERGELRSEEHTSELQSLAYLVCRLLLEKKKKNKTNTRHP